MKFGLIQWLFLFWVTLKEALQTENLRVHNLTFTEGEVYFHDFSPSLYLNPDGGFLISYSDEQNKKKQKSLYRSLEFRNTSFNIKIAKPNVDQLLFEKYTCIAEPFGNVSEVAIIYERNSGTSTSGQGKYFIQFKRIEYGNFSDDPIYYYPSQSIKDVTEIDMRDYTVQSSSCKQEIIINEFKRVLFICESITHNQYFVLSICSDSTCNEQTESLKIKDYVKSASFEDIRVKKMPGIDERTFSLIIWFDNNQYLECLLIDEVGKMESQVFKMDFNIKKVRYFSGQFLSFESTPTRPGLNSTYYFMFFDFGVKRLDFNKAKPREMLNFGDFVNSYVNSINGEVIVELLDGNMLLDMSLRRQTGEFMIEYSKRLFKQNETAFQSPSVFIFELGGDYQLVIESNKSAGSPSRGEQFQRFKVVNRFESVDSGAHNPFKDIPTVWRKISGFGKLLGCSISRFNRSQVQDPQNQSHPHFIMTMRDIHLAEPYVRIDARNSSADPPVKGVNPNTSPVPDHKRILRLLQDNNSIVPFTQLVNISKDQAQTTDGTTAPIFEQIHHRTINSTGFKIGYKESILKNNNITIESSGTSSDEVYPLKNMIRGNLMALIKACFSLDWTNCTNLKNRINPLLAYKTVMTTLNPEDLIVKELKDLNYILALASNHEYRSVFEILGYNQKLQNLSIFESKERTITRKKSEVQKINFNYSEVFNDTIFIIHSELGLYMYDSSLGNVKELIFDSGKCEQILLMRHTGLDLVLWCFFNTSASAFYARDVVEGKAGIRKIPVIIEKELNFSGKTLKFNDYFPEFIFMMSANNIIEVLKIETDSAVRISRIGKIALDEHLVNARMCDFDMIDRHLMIYHTQRIGYGDRILLNFYFIENPVKFVRTKLIPVDYRFSPLAKDLTIYRFEDKKKYGMARTKYSNKPMFMISVLYLNKYMNMLFIDIKATIAESIPYSLLPLSSEVTEMMVGKSLSTNEMHIRYSIVVFYEFDEYYKNPEDPTNEIKRRRVSMMKIEETDPALRLTNALDKNVYFANNSKGTLQYQYFVFEKDMISDSESEFNYTVHRVKLEGITHRLEQASKVQFSQVKLVQIDMSEIRNSNMIEIPGTIHSQLFWLQNPTNITQGDVSSWSYRMESLLEQSSNGIVFNSLIRNQTLLTEKEAETSIEFRTAAKTCTQIRRDYLQLVILGNLTDSVPVDFMLCINMKEMVFSVRVHNSSVPHVLNFSKNNDLLTTNPENLLIYTSDNILELVNYRKLNGRIVFTDFYKINLDLSGSVTNFKFNLKTITRRFFAETTKDYLIRASANAGTNKNEEMYEFYEWSIMKGAGRFYNVGLIKENWIIKTESEVVTQSAVVVNNLNMKLNETLQDGKSKIEIYEEFSFKVIDRNDRDYLWLILENPVYETYIIRYKIADLFKDSNQKIPQDINYQPYIWRLSNPYYGFESTYEIKALKSDWLLVHFKIMNEASYMMVYIVPKDVFPEKPNSNLQTLFVKESILFKQVIDLQQEKPLERIGSTYIT